MGTYIYPRKPERVVGEEESGGQKVVHLPTEAQKGDMGREKRQPEGGASTHGSLKG